MVNLQFSEHLAWSSHGQNFYNDLLPVPYNQATADLVDHINQVQDHLNTQMLLENPSNYLAFADSDMSEIEFLTYVTGRNGCGLLMDINNIYISATNQKFSPYDYIDAFPFRPWVNFIWAVMKAITMIVGIPCLLIAIRGPWLIRSGHCMNMHFQRQGHGQR